MLHYLIAEIPSTFAYCEHRLSVAVPQPMPDDFHTTPDEAPSSDLSSALQIPFCDDGHWQFGWGKGLYNFHEQHLGLWSGFGHCRYEPQSFAVEVAVAARKIAAAAHKPIYIGLSGGLDSELIARTFLQEKIPFTPLIAQYDNDKNKDDISYAFDFCRRHNLTPEVIKLDIVAFMEDCINTPYILDRCPFLLHMHLMRHAARLGGMAIIGLGEQKYVKALGKIYLPVPIARIAVIHFMQAEAVEGVPAFYCYTPELMLAFLREAKAFGFEDMDKMAHNLKVKIYHKFWPDLALRPKFDGFENVLDEKKIIRRKLFHKYGSKIAEVLIPIDELENQLAVARP